MKLITSHETTDFDALASCVALQKLFPGSVIGLSGGFAPTCISISRFIAIGFVRNVVETSTSRRSTC